MSEEKSIHQLTAYLFRENAGKMTAVLSRLFGLSNLDLVRDIIQDSFETALTQWRFSGVPENPSGWLMQVAKNKALNALKKEKTRKQTPSTFLPSVDEGFEIQFDFLLSQHEIKDSQLRLLFACCHPGLSVKNQIIVTLSILCGFGNPEIAHALLMQEEAVKKALARSKESLRELDQILQTRIITQLDDRIRTVQTVLYLLFNEGYKTTRGEEAINKELCFEAIRLAKLLEEENTETNALLALMFFNLSRFSARINVSEEVLSLEEQDRSQWNKAFIEEGYHYLNRAIPGETLSRFHIEAIIASLHCSAATFAETNWEKIAWLYRQLEVIAPSPLVTLNRVIAESYLSSAGSIQALEELEGKPEMDGNFLVPATKGDIYKRRGENREAIQSFEKAFALALSPVDKKFLKKKITALQACVNLNPN